MKTITNLECVSRHLEEYHDHIYIGSLCAFARDGQGTCFKDSGSPLIADGQLIGVVSWAEPCAVGRPDGFTRVSSFLGWIKNVAGVGAV